MAGDTRAFVGRGAELEELVEGLRATAAGRGCVWLVCGEAGIGKSRLVEELTEACAHEGVSPLWGRCWDSGGAPAYWPWIQILRSVLRGRNASQRDEVAATGPWIAQLLPELAADADQAAAPVALDPEQARFQLFDSVSALLSAASQDAPLLLIVEDLHAADPSSVLLLEFLAQQIRHAPVMVIGTYRDREAERSAVGALLTRVARDARQMELAALTRADVAAYLTSATAAPVNAEAVQSIYQRTEGNPLFIVEISRLLLRRGGFEQLATGETALPTSVKNAMRERLADMSDEAIGVLEIASVIGRELRAATLAQACGKDADELRAILDAALDAAVLEAAEPGVYRFTHVLLREVLHQNIPELQRWLLHRQLAEALEHSCDSAALPLQQLAYHYYEAGPDAWEAAVCASVRAAEQATRQLAFDGAAAAYQQAVTALARGPKPDPRRRAELLLGAGSSHLWSGDLDAGQQACRAAADIGRELGDPALLARAALEMGATFRYADVDALLVGLLREALAALGEQRSGLRARVMARLAAALQPAADPEGPFQLARDAIALARELDDERTLLDVLRFGCSALMDLADPAEREPLNRELVALAERLGEPVDAMRGSLRLAFDLAERGNAQQLRSAIDGCARRAAVLAHPYFQWHALALEAMQAIHEGRFAVAEQLAAEALRLGDKARDVGARRARLLQRWTTARLRGDSERMCSLATELTGDIVGKTFGRLVSPIVQACSQALAGQLEQARSNLSQLDIEAVVAMRDLGLLSLLAEACFHLEDRQLAARLHAALEGSAGRFCSWGMYGMLWGSPVDRYLGQVATVLQRWDEASRHFEAAGDLAKASSGRPHGAWIAFDWAVMLARSGAPTTAVGELLDRAERSAVDLDLSGLRERIRPWRELAKQAAPAAAAAPISGPPAAQISLSRDGDLWVLAHGLRSHHLKDTKGVRMLAQLVGEPGREFHALDLSSPPHRGPVADAGDAGELLDEQARSAYKTRVRELTETLEEAESWNDPARAAKARQELDFIHQELARAVGLGGRERRAGAASERARVNVQRRLRDAIRRISELDAELGRHLSWTVRTGTFCSYDPR